MDEEDEGDESISVPSVHLPEDVPSHLKLFAELRELYESEADPDVIEEKARAFCATKTELEKNSLRKDLREMELETRREGGVVSTDLALIDLMLQSLNSQSDPTAV